MENTKLVIVMNGGLIQSITANNENVEAIVIDLDKDIDASECIQLSALDNNGYVIDWGEISVDNKFIDNIQRDIAMDNRLCSL